MNVHLDVTEARSVGGGTYEITAQTPIETYTQPHVSLSLSLSGDEVPKAIGHGIDVEIKVCDG